MEDAAGGKNKVLLELSGTPIFIYSLRTLLASGVLERLVIVHRPEDEEAILKALKEEGALPTDRIELAFGGKERFESVYNGLSLLSESPPEIVVIHDSARPFPAARMVRESVEKAALHGAATVAIPLSDTLKRGDHGFLVETLPRNELYRIQTPQTFKFVLIWEAHQKLRQLPDPSVTDDCMLLEREGHVIAVVLGDETNIKVTTPFDLEIATTILEAANRAETGSCKP
jgi:2-C-methyl-D-erythritol 4-phosphate cytidylyltransferase